MRPLQTNDDVELLAFVKESDAAAFEVLYNRYWDKVLDLAYHKTGDLMEAENIVQDVFVSLWKRRETLEIKGNFSNYLFVSVKYRVLKVLARQSSVRMVSIDLAHDLLDDSTQGHLEFDEIRGRLEELVSQLPETCRLIYQLRNEDKTYKEIATQLNLSEKAVDAHLLRARRKLRIELGDFMSLFLL
ncbi:RNA polymerase sigma-70 factor [Mucilaginibacter boryungensis]|uniref:RNA polymerase sigma-70 factor n=1 Tax=Mucilaginibacter boryungensis TaxID=768480 RepID=A0ABR9XHA9_9SPHI|nr:RNA polymerase sigma-70 factor [Mucilaginibacter boryungensis]MBE9666767.1 RNA polymerase sigma-70 factor [Mucilaginibacter boryungensis]